MSASFGCRCNGTREERQKNWVVVERHQNRSYFHGGPRGTTQYSAYSEVFCKVCHALGRTKAKYVDLLPDGEIVL